MKGRFLWPFAYILQFVDTRICKRRINIPPQESFSVLYPHAGKILLIGLVAGGTLAAAAAAAALVYSWRGHTTLPCREETAYDPQSSELITGFSP